METTIPEQLNQLFLSCGMGFLLGCYYDVFRVIRLVMHSGKRWIFVQDMLFFLSSAVLTFLFSLAVMEGRLRSYLFVGELVGFVAYYFTIGKIVMRFAGRVVAVVVKVWNGFWRAVFAPFRFAGRLLGRCLRRPLAFLSAFFRKIGEKALQLLKKGLKHGPSLLYNHKKGAGKPPLAAVERESGSDEGR